MRGWLYVAGVLDRCSRRLVGGFRPWVTPSTLHIADVSVTNGQQLEQRRPGAGLLHHSDRGVQYASAAYRTMLADHGVTASMSRKANCYDNAVMEAFWSTLKNELVHRRRFNPHEPRLARPIFDYIEAFYNRTQAALGARIQKSARLRIHPQLTINPHARRVSEISGEAHPAIFNAFARRTTTSSEAIFSPRSISPT